MKLTINFVDKTNKRSPTLLAACQSNIETDEPDAVRDAYAKAIRQVHTPDFRGSAADLLAQASAIVASEFPNMVIKSVTDGAGLASFPKYTLFVELTPKK